MAKYSIVSDSSCDLPDHLIDQYDIDIIPYYVSFDQVKIYKERIDLSIDEFYKKLNSTYPNTSAPSIDDFVDKFTIYAKEGKDVLCISLTSKFSSSYNAATQARDIILDTYPDATIHVLDSRVCTGLQGLLVLEAAKMKNANYTLSHTVRTLKLLIPTGRIMFTIGTLDYLKNGGKIGKVSALAGTLLDIKPLIQVRDGELYPYGSVMGRKKSLNNIIQMTKEYFEEFREDVRDYSVCLTVGDCEKDSNYVLERLKEELAINEHIPVLKVGLTIGSYTGPDPIGITLIKRFDRM